MKRFKEYLDEAAPMIATAIEKGGMVYAYNEKGMQTLVIPTGSGRMIGFTQSTISIQKGGQIYVFDNTGRIVTVVLG